MHITQIRSVKLRGSALDSLSYNAVTRTNEWLQQWTCLGNFKAVITDTEEKGIEECRMMLRDELVPSWLSYLGVKPEHFSFEVSVQETDQYNRFWLNSSALIMRDYNV